MSRNESLMTRAEDKAQPLPRATEVTSRITTTSGADVSLRGHVLVEDQIIPFADARTIPPSLGSSEESSSSSSSEYRALWRCQRLMTLVILCLLIVIVVLLTFFGITCRFTQRCFGRQIIEPTIAPTSTPSVLDMEPPAPVVEQLANFVELLPSDVSFGDSFGTSIALSGDVLAVGSPLKKENNASKAGAAYIFRRSPQGMWVNEQKLLPKVVIRNSRFGRSVAVHNNRVVVGAYFDDHAGSFSGSAYVFAFTEGRWEEEQKLVAEDAADDSLFGFSVAIHDDVVFVGATNYNNRTGAVYIFSRDADGVWFQSQKMLGRFPGDLFGHSLALHEKGSPLVVGAMSSENAPDVGSAFVIFRLAKGWAALGEANLADGRTGDGFGFSVAIHGETVAVGSLRRDDGVVQDVGGVYIFGTENEREWNLLQEIRPQNAEQNTRFGHGVVMSSEHLAITSRYGGKGRTASADVYTRVGGSWKKRYSLVTSGDLRRATIAMSNSTIALGSSYGSSSFLNRSGAVYMFELPQ